MMHINLHIQVIHWSKKNRKDWLFVLSKQWNYMVIRRIWFIFHVLSSWVDVEQPYCILELNHPQQVQKTSLANNGLNPYVVNDTFSPKCSFPIYSRFWDERFLFECDDKSNQIHLQIIDRKQAVKRAGNNYGSWFVSFFLKYRILCLFSSRHSSCGCFNTVLLCSEYDLQTRCSIQSTTSRINYSNWGKHVF